MNSALLYHHVFHTLNLSLAKNPLSAMKSLLSLNNIEIFFIVLTISQIAYQVSGGDNVNIATLSIKQGSGYVMPNLEQTKY